MKTLNELIGDGTRAEGWAEFADYTQKTLDAYGDLTTDNQKAMVAFIRGFALVLVETSNAWHEKIEPLELIHIAALSAGHSIATCILGALIEGEYSDDEIEQVRKFASFAMLTGIDEAMKSMANSPTQKAMPMKAKT